MAIKNTSEVLDVRPSMLCGFLSTNQCILGDMLLGDYGMLGDSLSS